eukprot:gene10217-10287_t
MLSIRNIVKQYAGHTALSGVSLEVQSGQIFGLLGPNGAGKTSLIRIINQITAPDAGEVYFNGEKLNQSHIEKIGYLPEERGLYKKMEIGEQMIYLARLKGLSRDEADEILELNRKGATILFSTHRMESVEELCDSIALIHKSHKILDGTVKGIRNSYRSATYLVEYNGEQLIFDGNQPFEILKEIAGDDNNQLIKIKLTGTSTSNDVLQYLLPKTNINMLQEVIPSMNEIFIERVNLIP